MQDVYADSFSYKKGRVDFMTLPLYDFYKNLFGTTLKNGCNGLMGLGQR